MGKTATETSPAFYILALKVSVSELDKNKTQPRVNKEQIKLIKMKREGEVKQVWSPSLHQQASDHY